MTNRVIFTLTIIIWGTFFGCTTVRRQTNVTISSPVEDGHTSVRTEEKVCTVQTPLQLVKAIERHERAIFIEPHLSLNLDDLIGQGIPLPIEITSSMKIYSSGKSTISATAPKDQRWSGGATITWNPTQSQSMFSVKKNITVSFEGLQFEGNQNKDVSTSCIISYLGDITLRNCEIRGFTYSGLSISGSVGSQVESCYIHDNSRLPHAKSGYGVAIGGSGQSFVTLRNNLFSNNWHDIAGGSIPGNNGFSAIKNICLNNGPAQNFDMHGSYHYKPYDKNRIQAGDSIIIKDNTFYLTTPCPAIYIRGLPKKGAIIENNTFISAHPTTASMSEQDIIAQGYLAPDTLRSWWFNADNQPMGNITVRNNSYPSGKVKGIYVSWNGNESLRRVGDTLTDTHYWVTRIFGGNRYQRNDLFHTSGVNSRFSSQIDPSTGKIRTRSLQKAIKADTQFLTIGDFTGDHLYDILYSSDSDTTWHVLPRGDNPLSKLLRRYHQSHLTIPDVIFSDFLGDEKSDMFFTDQGKWMISENTHNQKTQANFANFKEINTSDIQKSQLGFADFDGDNKTDIFHGDSTFWYVWYAKDSWANRDTIAKESTTVSQLQFGDFNGDNNDDIFYANGAQWQYFNIKNMKWELLKISPLPNENLLLGDFDYNGKCDIMIVNYFPE